MAAALAMASQSCNKVDPLPHGSGYPILFNSAEYNTKATATKEDVQEYGFKVYANYSLNGANFEFNKDVTYSGGYWGYEETEYWWPGANYIFRAFYPKSGDFSLSVNKDGFTLSNYDVTSQVDLLYASAERSVAENAIAPTEGSVVLLNFEHLLANVTIKVKSQIDGVTIQKITLGGIDTNSEYNGNIWNSSNTTSIEYNSSKTLTKGADYVDVTDGGILVVPARSNKSLTVEANKTYNLTLPAGTWEPGNRYTYTIEIKQDDIVFVDNAPYVEDWDSENATGSVIIK